MSPSRRSQPQAEQELEQEVDFGRYFRTLAGRWWLLVIGVVVGALIGAALTAGQKELYRARATLYLGQPLAATGTTQIQSLNTNPSTVGRLARSESIVSEASDMSGLPEGKLRSGISTATVQGYLSKQGQTPLVTISIKADAPPRQVTDAANALAELVLEANSRYPQAKIDTLNAQIASYKSEIEAIDKRLESINASLDGRGLSALERQVLLTAATVSEQRRGVVSDELRQSELLLTQAETVEMGSIVAEGRAIKTTARSRRNSLVVGAALGLLVAALVALTLPARRRGSD